MIGVHNRGSGASVESEGLFIDSSGDTIYRTVNASFLVGAKDFKDSGITNAEKVTVPKRSPDATVEMPTSPYQAQIYRLSSDYNPLHVDPGVAKKAGFPGPILHGLCSFGISARAVLKQYCENDPKNFKAMRVRFAKPVMPGDTLVVEMWKEGNKVIFVTKSKTSGEVCLNNAYLLMTSSAKM